MPSAFERMLQRQLKHASQPLTRHRLLVAHLEYAWDRVRPRLEGLTDEEFLWEPAEGSWTVRPQADGTYLADWAWPEPDPPPFTTVAWRLSHIGMTLDMRANHRFGDGTLTVDRIRWPGSAEAALTWIDDGYARYHDGVASLTDAELDEPPAGPPGYLDTRFPYAMCIQHITLELIHHGAEVALLRDLYRATEPRGDGPAIPAPR